MMPAARIGNVIPVMERALLFFRVELSSVGLCAWKEVLEGTAIGCRGESASLPDEK